MGLEVVDYSYIENINKVENDIEYQTNKTLDYIDRYTYIKLSAATTIKDKLDNIILFANSFHRGVFYNDSKTKLSGSGRLLAKATEVLSNPDSHNQHDIIFNLRLIQKVIYNCYKYNALNELEFEGIMKIIKINAGTEPENMTSAEYLSSDSLKLEVLNDIKNKNIELDNFKIPTL